MCWSSEGELLELTLKRVLSKAQMLQPLCSPDKHDHILRDCLRVKNFWQRVREGNHSIDVSKVALCWYLFHISFCSTDYPQKLKISTQEKFWLQRRGGSEQRDKRSQIGLKNDKRTQIGKMPIARRSSAAELGERFDVNFSVCLLHAALPEILLLASSVQGAPARIRGRPNVLEKQFLCKKWTQCQVVQLRSLPL